MNDYYKQIPGENMFDFEDYYSSIAEWLPSNSNIAEVGCADGRSGIYLAEKIHSLGKGFRLYMIDNMAYGGDDQMFTLMKNIFGSGMDQWITLVRSGSLDASCKFPDHLLDFVFLDSSHQYPQTKAELLLWPHKIKTGGILAGHDYFSTENPGVYQAVQEMIPLDKLETHQTRHGLGVWSTKIIR